MATVRSAAPARFWALALAGALAVVAHGEAAAHQAIDRALARLIAPAPPGPRPDRDTLVERGRRLFADETFGGNGRTCATCHPPSNNFTLDPAYIAGLRRHDPLFVAERDPRLAGLENPALLRRNALILENVDGFDQPGVLRSVSHTLGLRLSTTPDRGGPTREPFPLAGATGWSGDGAPGDGSLRMFAVGGVVQHLTRTLERVPGRDFRVPREDELDALLAYQLSLGPQQAVLVDPADPASLAFRDPFVEDGRRLFHAAPARDGGTRGCGGCHARAGANDRDGNNRQFDTGTALMPNAPACLAPGAAPGDGGFGASPVQVRNASAVCGGTAAFPITFRGTGAFNTPSLVEAADTPPFFHNNTAATIEDAVAFYGRDEFDRSPAGAGRAFALDADGVNRVAGFLRALNALENVRDATGHLDAAIGRFGPAARASAEMALAQTDDAIAVLTRGPVGLFAATGATGALWDARDKLARALRRPNPALMAAARIDLARARTLIVQ